MVLIPLSIILKLLNLNVIERSEKEHFVSQMSTLTPSLFDKQTMKSLPLGNEVSGELIHERFRLLKDHQGRGYLLL